MQSRRSRRNRDRYFGGPPWQRCPELQRGQGRRSVLCGLGVVKRRHMISSGILLDVLDHTCNAQGPGHLQVSAVRDAGSVPCFYFLGELGCSVRLTRGSTVQQHQQQTGRVCAPKQGLDRALRATSGLQQAGHASYTLAGVLARAIRTLESMCLDRRDKHPTASYCRSQLHISGHSQVVSFGTNFSLVRG